MMFMDTRAFEASIVAHLTAVNEAVGHAVDETVVDVQREAKHQCDESQMKIYDTGALRHNIQAVFTGQRGLPPHTGAVTSEMPYSPYVHDGTSRMKGKPYLNVAKDKNKAKFYRNMAQAMRGGK